jgi:ATP/maltotriose-dependent transcriptional regulator MalT
VEQLLTTKLYIPFTRPELVPRLRLVTQLNEGLHHKVALVSAPAGFGKTTLVSEWVRNLQLDSTLNTVCWLSLDTNDNDLVRFLTYFIATLRRGVGIETSIGAEALELLKYPQPPSSEDILTSLINEIADIRTKIIIVLDDYHLIEDQSIHEALTFFIEFLPPQIHLVISTRQDPNLSLGRLRARGQLTELRAADLRFTLSEAAAFLNQMMGLNLVPEDIAALETRTEGWIAGLQLAAISMKGHKDAASFIKLFTGSHRFVLDYLIEEVLQQQPENIQTFLLQTAVLDWMTGSLCDALTCQTEGQAILETLEQTNLFIVPLDNERRWYRYHHLFGELLRERLVQSQPERLPTLYHRASEWYEQNGFIDESIEYALRSEDFGRSTCLIEAQADVIWERGEDTKLLRWLNGLPAEVLFSKPYLCIFHAWSLFATGQQDIAARCLQAAELVLNSSKENDSENTEIDQDQLSSSDRMKLRGRVATTRAFLAFYQGDVSGIFQYAQQALEYLPEEDLSWRSTAFNVLGDAHDFKGDMAATHKARLDALKVNQAAGNSYQIMVAHLKLAINLRRLGQLNKVIEICQQQMQFGIENGLSQSVVVGWLLGIWGEVLAEINDLDGAIQKARKGVTLTERGGDLAMIAWSYQCLTRVLFSTGDLAGAEEILHKMEIIARKYDVPAWMMNMMAAWQARIWLAQNKLASLSQWVRQEELDSDGEIAYLEEMEYMLLARILLAQGKLGEAGTLLRRLLGLSQAGGRTFRVIEVLLLQALVFQAQGDSLQALTVLKKALILAEPGGFIRTIVDEGPPIEKLLKRMKVENGRLKGYIQKLLSAFAHPSSARPQPLIEPLSERELEVLQLIAEGLTNQEIASRLYLSLNTVKVHTRNIYGKMGTNNRTQAAAKARELEIL